MNIGKHVFPTAKFRLYKEALEARGLLSPADVEHAPAPSDEQVLSALHPEYLADLRSGRHSARTVRSELPISREIVEGCIRTSGGTIRCVELALDSGAAVHLGGGFHHGFSGHGEGFCYVNDVAIAAAWALRAGWVSRVAVVDTDVHQGNGTAAILEHEPRAFTFSIHQENLYPKKERSDLDIGLDEMIGDEGYLLELRRGMDAVLAFKPELAIVVAGVDPYEGDQLGRLGITMQGMRRREEETLGPLARAGIPFVTVTGGGYARRLDDTVALHAQTATVAIEVLA
jgi:acetoin utilization deacetylase AcuC-like enzyme